jgi:hypothetical protein
MNTTVAVPRATDWLVGGGELGELIRARDWSATPLGPVERWPQSLRSAVSILLPSRAQICLFWGPRLVAIYNDAYRPTLGVKHPWALGKPGGEVFSEIWEDVLRPLLEGVLQRGEAFWANDHPFHLERRGFVEETYFDISYDPVRDESGRVGGVFCIVSETSGRVIGERRLKTLRELGRRTMEARTVAAVYEEAAAVLARADKDLAFALLYEWDAQRGIARRAALAGLAARQARSSPRKAPRASTNQHPRRARTTNQSSARIGARHCARPAPHRTACRKNQQQRSRPVSRRRSCPPRTRSPRSIRWKTSRNTSRRARNVRSIQRP